MWLILLAIYAAVLLLKLVLVAPATGPAVFWDEHYYKEYAVRISQLEAYTSPTVVPDLPDPLYPPLYPALLSLGRASATEWHLLMLVLNCCVGSLVVFVAYHLARLLVTHEPAVAAAAIAGVLPTQLVYPPSLLAENLSVPLFLLAFWLALRPPLARRASAIAFGGVLGASFLTKYVFLAYMPIVVAAFAATQWFAQGQAPWRGRLRWVAQRLGLAFGGGACVLGLWLAYSLGSGHTLWGSFGMALAPVFKETKATGEGLLVYAVLVSSGTFLSLALLLPSALAFFAQLLRRRRAAGAVPWTYAATWVAVVAFFVPFVTRFCWIESGAWEPGEYGIDHLRHFISLRYFVPVLLVLTIPPAVAALEALSRATEWSRPHKVIAGLGVVCVGVSLLTHSVLFTDSFREFPLGVTANWANATAIFSLRHAPVVAGGIAVAGALVPAIVVWRRSAWRPRYTAALIAGVALPVYVGLGLQTYLEVWPQYWKVTASAKDISLAIERSALPPEQVLVVVEPESRLRVGGEGLLAPILEFWLEGREGKKRVVFGSVRSSEVEGAPPEVRVETLREGAISSEPAAAVVSVGRDALTFYRFPAPTRFAGGAYRPAGPVRSEVLPFAPRLVTGFHDRHPSLSAFLRACRDAGR